MDYMKLIVKQNYAKYLVLVIKIFNYKKFFFLREGTCNELEGGNW